MPNNEHELLPLVVQENNVLIDAALLHQKLKAKGRFYDWITYRIKEYCFEENKDFFATKKVQSKQGGHNRIEYLLTLDMAKELAMLERNEVGRTIRRYFIAKEKELRSQSQLPHHAELFRGLKAKNVNDRRMYPYKEILKRCGYSTKSGTGQRRARYWQHFIKEGHELYITQEMALHLHHQRQVFNNRLALKEMQPVLPFDFGNPLQLKGGAL